MSADQLIGIYANAQALAEEEDQWRRLACPNDGTPYSYGPNGELYCRHDGYRPEDALT